MDFVAGGRSAGIVDPVVHGAECLYSVVPKCLDLGFIGGIASGTDAVAVAQCIQLPRDVFNVGKFATTDNSIVPKLDKLFRESAADSPGAPGDYDSCHGGSCFK